MSTITSAMRRRPLLHLVLAVAVMCFAAAVAWELLLPSTHQSGQTVGTVTPDQLQSPRLTASEVASRFAVRYSSWRAGDTPGTICENVRPYDTQSLDRTFRVQGGCGDTPHYAAARSMIILSSADLTANMVMPPGHRMFVVNLAPQGDSGSLPNGTAPAPPSVGDVLRLDLKYEGGAWRVDSLSGG